MKPLEGCMDCEENSIRSTLCDVISSLSNSSQCTSEQAIRCTLPNCTCECFAPGKLQLRACDTCKHGWVAHALDKLGYRHMYTLGMQVEIVQPNIVFDIASLMLYGAQATPIRLKILLDRLFSVLQHDEVLQVLHGFGWTYEDYARGYILQAQSSGKSTPEQLPYKKRSEVVTPPHPPPLSYQHFRSVRPISPNYQSKEDSSGRVLDKWTIASREEEQVIIQQFLRFGETKSIAQEIILQDTKEKQQQSISQTARAESEIKKFIERTNSSTQGYIRPYDSRHLLSGRVPYVHSGSRLMAPVSSLHSFSPVPPPNTELRSPSVPITNSTALSTSPLGRLQTMQPFDYRRDQSALSPAVSPGIQEKRQPLQSPPQHSPQNYTMVTSTPVTQPSVFTPKALELKEEPITANSVPLVTTPDDSTNDAINYSIKDQDLQVIEQERKSKHLRKAVNPVKRHWAPTGAFGSTFVSPSGKKRVLCTACNKTFCDKGALKIHYSAVHLKEMHKCTVDGCNMMFSSRRSRNRHSANPNPKLHMPQKRKIEGSGLLSDSKGSPRLPTMVVSSAYGHHSPDSDQSLGEVPQDMEDSFFDVSSKLSFIPTPEKRIKLNVTSSDEMLPDSSMVSRHRASRREESRRHELSSSRGSRRKSNAPTRCAQTDEMFALSDDNGEDHGSENHRRNKTSNADCVIETEQDEVLEQDEDTDDEGQSIEFEDPRTETIDDKESLVIDESEEPQNLSTKGREGRGVNSKDNPSTGYPKIVSLLTNKNSAEIPMDLSSEVSKSGQSEAQNTVSDPESVDSDSTKINESSEIDLSDLNSGDQPLDKENPKRCPACRKSFQNIFGVKTHYRNVHLKVMHECTVDGCTAAFPSKRSRDRHSNNVNIHLKGVAGVECNEKTNGKHKGEEEDKENEGCESGVEEFEKDLEESIEDQENCGRSNAISSSSDSSSDISQEESSTKLKSAKGSENGNEEDMEDADETVHCHICEEKFRDNLALKEHFESIHPKEMFKCTVKGCDKIFSTRKSRNRHSHNDNLHRYMTTPKTNGVS